MALVECRSCGGQYHTISSRGVPYYHVCPPLSLPEYKVEHPEFQGTTPPYALRPDHRDENVTINPATGRPEPKNEGQGPPRPVPGGGPL